MGKRAQPVAQKAAGSAQPAKKRRLGRRTTEECVQRIVTENYSTLSAQEVDGIKVGNKTLREKLLTEKRQAKRSKTRISGQMLDKMRAQYTQKKAKTGLAVKNAEEEPSQAR